MENFSGCIMFASALPDSIMVVLKILVLPVWVRILIGQLLFYNPFVAICYKGIFVLG